MCQYEQQSISYLSLGLSIVARNIVLQSIADTLDMYEHCWLEV